MIKTYTYKLYDNQKYLKKYNEWEAICRYVYNLSLETKETNFKSGINLSNYDLSNQLTQCKHTEGFEWLKKVSADTLQYTLGMLDKAYNKFYSDCKDGNRDRLRAKYLKKCSYKGEKVNWSKYYNISRPKFRSKRNTYSIPFTSGKKSKKTGLRVLKQTKKGFKLPVFGEVKVFNNRKIVGDIKTAQLKKKVDGIYLTVQFEDISNQLIDDDRQDICAIDIGISRFLTVSDGEYVDNPKFLENKLKELRIQQRKLSRMTKDSKNWKKQRILIQRLYKKVTDCRTDFLHKQSSELAKYFNTVVREDLKVSEMILDRRFSRSISDVSWGKFFELLEYKTNVIKVNPAYTSQTCSKCGNVDKQNRKTQSVFKCTSCGFEENADFNGALNILEKGLKQIEARALASGSQRNPLG